MGNIRNAPLYTRLITLHIYYYPARFSETLTPQYL